MFGDDEGIAARRGHVMTRECSDNMMFAAVGQVEARSAADELGHTAPASAPRITSRPAAAESDSFWADWLGMAASIGCAIHCAAMPFVIVFLPTLGLSFLADASFHKLMVAICTLLAAAAFVPGWRRHRRLLPTAIAAAGLIVIAVAAFALPDACCATCTLRDGVVPNQTHGGSHAAAPAAWAASPPASTISSSDGAACLDTRCETCAGTTARKVQLEPTGAERSRGHAGFTAWLTPLGGLLLIVAHLINRRFSCRRGCCPSQAEPQRIFA